MIPSRIEILCKEEGVQFEVLERLKFGGDVNRLLVCGYPRKFIIGVSDDFTIGIYDYETFCLLNSIEVFDLYVRDVIEWDHNTIICCSTNGWMKVLSLLDTHPFAKVVKEYDPKAYSNSSRHWYRLLKIDDEHFVAGHSKGISLFSFEKGHLKKFTHDVEVEISWYSNFYLSPKQNGIFYSGHVRCIKSWNFRFLNCEKTFTEDNRGRRILSRIYNSNVFLNRTTEKETIITSLQDGGIFLYNAETKDEVVLPFMCLPVDLGPSVCITDDCWTSSQYISSSHSDYLLLGDSYGVVGLFRVSLGENQLEMIYEGQCKGMILDLKIISRTSLGMRCACAMSDNEIVVFEFKNVNVSEREDEESVFLEERIEYFKEMYEEYNFGCEENLLVSIILENCRIDNVSKLLFL